MALLQRSDSALNHTDGYWKLWFSRGSWWWQRSETKTLEWLRLKAVVCRCHDPSQPSMSVTVPALKGKQHRHTPTRRQYSGKTILVLWKTPDETTGDHRPKSNTAALTALTVRPSNLTILNTTVTFQPRVKRWNNSLYLKLLRTISFLLLLFSWQLLRTLK